MLSALFAWSAHAEKYKLGASIEPLTRIISAVGGDLVEVETLLPKNADIHHYAMRPREIASLKRLDLVFWFGPELEMVLARPLKRFANKHHSLLQGLRPATGQKLNPHLWLDPDNAARIAWMIAELLQQRYPEGAEQLHQNAEKFDQQMSELDKEMRQVFSKIDEIPFAVTHNVIENLVAKYHLNQVAILGDKNHGNYSLRNAAAFRKAVAANKVHCIFVEPGVNATTITRIVESKVSLVALDPLGAKVPDGEGFTGLLRSLVAEIRDCLHETR